MTEHPPQYCFYYIAINIKETNKTTNYNTIPLYLQAHAQKEKYTQRIKQTSKSLTDQGYSVITLNDNQAIFINDGTKQLLEFSEELKSVDNVLE